MGVFSHIAFFDDLRYYYAKKNGVPRCSEQETCMKKRLLVIDDEEMNLNALKLILEDMGYEVTTFNDPFKGEKEAISAEYDLIVTDLRMPGKNGAEVAEGILGAKPKARVLILTAYPTDPLAKRALDAGALSLLKKPFEIAKILDFLE
jgi:DNA-binding NtrC family response regulator